MRRVQRTAQIAATPAEVYAFLAEPANLPRWQAGMVSAERTSPPPTVVGSTARVVLELMGQQVTAEITVREAERERRLALAASMSGMGVVATLDLAPHDGGTEITLASEVRAENIFMAPLERMVTDAAERDLEASLARLAAALTQELRPS
ncbi:MAG TPA: SRPBCC family protein [Jatrophihabitantaceae bacterium]|nr:SRPBCC family protein [Jatrophihabitantaceae bacterium]